MWALQKKKKDIHHLNAGADQMQVQQCNQLGHETVICNNTFQKQEADTAQVTREDDDNHIFVEKCFSSKTTTWLTIELALRS